jgi:protein subunit release factor A
MKDYQEDLHNQIRSLFKEDELKFDIKMVKDNQGRINHDASVGIKVTHIDSRKEIICESYESQIQNANIALLKLKKVIDKDEKTRSFTD